MARFNTPSPLMTLSAATTFSYAFSGGIIALTGAAGYTVTLVAPASGPGVPQTFYNGTGGLVTLATPSGSIIGSGLTSASSQTIPNNATYTLTSNGTNYVLANNEGGAIQATTGSFSAAVTMSPVSANVTISPTGSGTVTVNPATAGTINNMSIGVTTRGAGAFTTLDANSTVGLSPANAAVTISPTGSGNVVIGPATAGTINNMSIGATTRGAGNFTSLDANSTVGLSPANAAVTISPTGSGTVTINPASGLTINPGTTASINNVNIGATTAGTGRFSSVTVTGSTSLNTGTISTAPSNGTDIANKTYVDNATTTLPLYNSISSDTTLAAGRAAFSNDLTITAVYTISSGACHVCL